MAQRLTEHDEALLRDYELHRRTTDADVRHAASSRDATRARGLLAAAVRAAGSSPDLLRAAGRVVEVDLEVAPADARAFEVLAQVLRDGEGLAAAGGAPHPSGRSGAQCPPRLGRR